MKTSMIGVLIAITLATTACGGSGGGSATPPPPPPPVAPSISTQPSGQTVTAGQTATFSVSATGTAPLSYQWAKNGANISGATSSSYTTPATTSADNGSTFQVTVSNSAGSVTSHAATLTVNAAATAPSITTQPTDQTVVVGQVATFSVVASGTQPLGYQWAKNGSAINGATSSSYTTPATTTADNGSTFQVTVSNSAGSAVSRAATLTVNQAATKPSITTQPTDQTVTAGQTATFSVVASGTAPLSYQWAKNGSAINGATSASYTTPATTSADNNSTFQVTVSNTAGNAVSRAATLTVTQQSGITASTSTTGFYVEAGGIFGFNLTLTGAAVGDAVHQVMLGQDITVGTITASNINLFTIEVPISTSQLVRSDLGYYVLRGDGTKSNMVWVGLLGNLQKMSRASSTDVFYVQGPGAKILKFKLDGTADGQINFSGFNGIGFDPTDQFLVGAEDISVVSWFTPAGTGGGGLATPGVAVGTDAASHFGFVTVPTSSSNGIGAFDMTAQLFTLTSVNGGNGVWSVAGGMLGPSGNPSPFALEYAREDTVLNLYSSGLSLVGSFTPAGVTPKSALPLTVGGWPVELFSQCAQQGSCPAAGSVVFLSVPDQLLVFGTASPTGMTETGHMAASGGDPDLTQAYATAKDDVHGKVILGYNHVANGNTTFASVDPKTGTLVKLTASGTPLATPTGFLASDILVSADGTTLYATGTDPFTGTPKLLSFANPTQ